MNDIKCLPVTISSVKGHQSQGSVELRAWEKRERTIRGLRALGIAWGLALASVLIPILHFILVPLLLLAGPIAFFMTVGQERIILGGTGECPDCKRTFDIVRSSVKWPINDVCNHCHSQLQIERAP